MKGLETRIARLSPEKRELLEALLGGGQADAGEPSVGPRNETEELLAAIWQEVLGIDRVGVEDNFFELGGDSIHSIQVIAKAEAAGLRMTSTDLFAHPTIAEVARVVRRISSSSVPGASAAPGGADGPRLEADELRAAAVALPDREVEDAYPLTALQQGMLFHVLQAGPGSGVYLEQTACTLRGPLDLTAFARAWQRVVDRHPALRTAFLWEDLPRPVQAVLRQAPVSLRVVDGRSLEEARRAELLEGCLRRERVRGLDLTEPPLLRLLLVRWGPAEHRLVWTSYHLILDAWCLNVVLREVMTLYRDLLEGHRSRLAPVRPFRELVGWLERRDLAESERFWRRELEDLPAAGAKGDLEAGAGTGEIRQAHRRLGEGATRSLTAFARGRGLTLATVAHGAWALLLARRSGEGEALFGTVVSGRSAGPPGVEEMVGPLINTLPLRVPVPPQALLGPWLADLQDRQARLQRHEHTPLVEIVRWSGRPPGMPLFETLLVFLNAVDLARHDTGDLTIGDVEATGHSNYPLVIRATPGPRLLLEALYDPGRLSEDGADALLAELEDLLRHMAAEPGRHLGAVLGGDRGERRIETMERSTRRQLDIGSLRAARPKRVDVEGEALVRFEPFGDGAVAAPGFLYLARPATEGVDLAAWVQGHREAVEERLRTRGAVLFRGFGLDSAEGFESLVRHLDPDLLEYRERSTPRTQVSGRIYTSTEYPPDQEIVFHNEFSYGLAWPLKLCFLCLSAPEEGGETPLADSRRVVERLSPGVRERFVERGVLYVRNYGHGVDLPWQEAFQTDERADVEAYCRDAAIDFEWLDGDRLRTRQVRPAVARHPHTGDLVWFNQAHLFHVSNLVREVRESMLELFSEEDLPRHAFYGDGSPIADAELDEVRSVYAESSLAFPWREGDVLVVDNMLVAHGRRPFRGKRRVVVGMTESHRPGGGPEGG